MEIVKYVCNLCNNDKFKILYKSNIPDEALKRFAQYAYYSDIIKCLSCGLVVQKPIHNINEIQALLKQETYLDEEIGQLNLIQKKIQFDFYINMIKTVVNPCDLNILDIGTNTGVFLLQMKEYTDNLYGIEPSKEAAMHCKKMGLDVQNCLIDENNFPKNKFDIVTMWDVIEHLYNPNNDLKEISTLIKSGGILCISTHDIDGTFAKILGKRYPMFMYQHFYHFSKKTLQNMLIKNNFEIIKIVPFCKTWTIIYLYHLVEKLWQKSFVTKIFYFILDPIKKIKALHDMQLTIPIKNFFIIIAKRCD